MTYKNYAIEFMNHKRETMNKEKLRRVNFDCPENIYLEMKWLAIKLNITIKDLNILALKKTIDEFKKKEKNGSKI